MVEDDIPQEDSISKNTLEMMDKSAENFKEGKVSEPIELKNSYRPEEKSEPNYELEALHKPFFSQVLVRLNEVEVVKEGIIIPDTAQGKQKEATVIAVGHGHLTESGVLVPLRAKPGMVVLLPEFGLTEQEMDGYNYAFVDEKLIVSAIDWSETTTEGTG